VAREPALFGYGGVGHVGGEPFDSRESAGEAVGDGVWVVESAVFKIMPSDPALADQEVGRSFEDVDQGDLIGPERPDALVGLQGSASGRRITTEPFADQTREIPGNRVDSHRSEVDDAGQAVAFEEEMFGSSVAQTWLETNVNCRCFLERVEHPRGEGPGQRQPVERCRRMTSGRVKSALDGRFEAVKPTVDQVPYCLGSQPETW
jgi:hypothetical protein